MINKIKGDASLPIGEGRRIIAHIVNDIGAWGRGFTAALNKHYSGCEGFYRRSHHLISLGEILFYEDGDIIIANIMAQKGLRNRNNPTPFSLDALKTALPSLNEFAINTKASIHMPYIGAGLGGGNWSEIEKALEEELKDCEVYIYSWGK